MLYMFTMLVSAGGTIIMGVPLRGRAATWPDDPGCDLRGGRGGGGGSKHFKGALHLACPERG
jgi:hypothetical protein